MLEQKVCLLHSARSEASDLFHTVSLCGLSRFVFVFSLDHWFVVWLSLCKRTAAVESLV